MAGSTLAIAFARMKKVSSTLSTAEKMPFDAGVRTFHPLRLRPKWCLTLPYVRPLPMGCPSNVGEEDVMIAVAAVDGRELDPEALLHFLAAQMPYFMVPRYIRVLPELPKTPTAKVQKHLLRAAGVTSDSWDREAHGISLHRDKLQ